EILIVNRLEGERPANPGEGRIDRGLDLRVGPGGAVVETDLNPGDIPVAGRGHAGGGGGAWFDGAGGMVDPAPDLVRRRVAPAAGLPVAFEVEIDQFDPVEPLHVLHSVNARNDQAGRKPVVIPQRFAV